MEPDSVVVCRSFSTLAEAELAIGALVAYGIDAAYRRGHGLHLATTFDVLVREDDVAAALDVLGTEQAQ